tara:strand:- start:541 stop:2142 length:1602 start_codon:yes stop_codon:yes gene_type:complete
MAASQPFGISCKGGLNTNLNQLELLGQPGFATELKNFEVDPDGGYRRINGYTAFGDTRPNSNNPLLGLAVYADGVIACSTTNIYFTNDGTTWLQINKASVDSGGDNFSTFSGRSALARTSQGQCSITVFEGNEEYGQVLICDGANKPFFFKMTGSGALSGRTYFAQEITVSGSVAPKVGVIHDKHFVVAGASTQKNTLFYSATLDPTSFSGTGSGSIAIDDQIIGLKSFRTDLIIFCENSLYRLININDSSNIAVVPIAQNVGCLSHFSIQEIGGDLVFLSPDGIRSVAGTARIGDVELGSLSRQIQSVTSIIARDIDDFTITSCVLRRRSQYRLYYSTTGGAIDRSKGIIGTLTQNGFEWSETEGIQASALVSDFNASGIEKIFHGDKNGYIYNHDTGNSFIALGTAFNINAKYTTPFLDFGDVGTRKTMKYLKLSVSPEGTIAPILRTQFDFVDTNVAQPADITLSGIPTPPAFGSAIFGTAIFEGTNDPMAQNILEGSGHTVSFQVRSEDQRPPYSLNGLYINYVPSGRR